MKRWNDEQEQDCIGQSATRQYLADVFVLRGWSIHRRKTRLEGLLFCEHLVSGGFDHFSWVFVQFDDGYHDDRSLSTGAEALKIHWQRTVDRGGLR